MVCCPLSPDYSVGVSVSDPFFLIGHKMTGLVQERLCMKNPAREVSVQSHHWASEGILESDKGQIPGGTEGPQLSLESAGLRSLIPKTRLDAASLRGVLQRKTSASAPSNGSLLQTINCFV